MPAAPPPKVATPGQRVIKLVAGDPDKGINPTYTALLRAIDAGTLKISADRNLGAVPNSAVAHALSINGGTLQVTADVTISAGRGMTLGSNGATFQTDPSVSVNYAGVIAGSAGLTKSGSGSLVLTGTNTHTGSLTVAGGTLQLGNGTTGALAEASNIVIDAGGKLTLQAPVDEMWAKTVERLSAPI